MSGVGGPVRVDDSDAGTRVKGRRTEASLSQQSLADLVGVSRQTIVAMETGSYAPSVYLALRVANVLDTTVEALWGADPTA
jgi:putative transcriptional regulator